MTTRWPRGRMTGVVAAAVALVALVAVAVATYGSGDGDTSDERTVASSSTTAPGTAPRRSSTSTDTTTTAPELTITTTTITASPTTAAAPTTVPPPTTTGTELRITTTVPPATVLPTTAPRATMPPVAVPPTTAPRMTFPPATAPRMTPPPITAPPVTAPPRATPPPPPAPAPAPVLAPPGETTIATARAGIGSIGVFADPGVATPRMTLQNPSPEYGGTQVFVVRERRDGFMRVALPVRPNGSTGWVRESDVDLARHRYRIDVSLSGHHFRVVNGDQVVLEGPAGIGTSDTPTPGGEYYTWVLLDPTNGGYGAYAYGLSGFSERLTEFAGGGGRLGIHGTTDPSSLGRDVSNGCIRISNADVTALVERIGLPLGVPVVVTA